MANEYDDAIDGVAHHTHLDDGEMFGCLAGFKLAKLEVDRLDLALQHGRLQLEVEVEHRLRLTGQVLRLGLLCRLVLPKLFEIAAAGKTIGQERVRESRSERDRFAHA